MLGRINKSNIVSLKVVDELTREIGVLDYGEGQRMPFTSLVEGETIMEASERLCRESLGTFVPEEDMILDDTRVLGETSLHYVNCSLPHSTFRNMQENISLMNDKVKWVVL